MPGRKPPERSAKTKPGKALPPGHAFRSTSKMIFDPSKPRKGKGGRPKKQDSAGKGPFVTNEELRRSIFEDAKSQVYGRVAREEPAPALPSVWATPEEVERRRAAREALERSRESRDEREQRHQAWRNQVAAIRRKIQDAEGTREPRSVIDGYLRQLAELEKRRPY